MKVCELIACLQALPQDADVYVDGYESGVLLLAATGIRTGQARPKEQAWGGSHQEVWWRAEKTAVFLSRRDEPENFDEWWQKDVEEEDGC